MDLLSVPETAISTFEHVHDVLVTVHDFTGRIRPRLAVNRSYHRHPLCHAAKARDHERACLAFDLVGLHAAAPLHPHGFLQRCHAGLVEAIATVRLGGEVVAILNAGPRSADGELPILRSAPLPAGVRRPALPRWNAEQGERVLESLRQLAARLERWLEEIGSDTTRVSDRRSQILHAVAHGAPKGLTLGQLADRLGLSIDRTGHVVREEFGVTFSELVANHRLERAAELLTHSDLPIATIALNSGFGDVSSFHRRFKARYGTTPRAFRVERKAPAAEGHA
jgi:AraC-like DNA-binding protein